MFTGNRLKNVLRCLLLPVVCITIMMVPNLAWAGKWAIVDKLDLSPFVPRVLDAFITVARGTYEFFVGNGNGLVYDLVWGFMLIAILLYAGLMWFPKKWTTFLGFSGGGEMWEGKTSGFTMAETVLKTVMRAVIAATLLLQVKPVYVTQWIVNPFLEFGALYTEVIFKAQNQGTTNVSVPECPQSVMSGDWISPRSCEFLIKPIAQLSAENNKIIKRGFEFFSRGLRNLISVIPHGSQSILDIITGILLVTTFVGCNLFMALLIIQGIFDFGMALILYPFSVLAYVAKRSDKWFDVWPAFDNIITALQKLVIVMIACAFILVVNTAVVRALFNTGSMESVVAGGSASSNLNATAVNFGGHSLLWLSALLTFFLMSAIFDMTRKRLEGFAKGMTGLYDQTKSDFKATKDWTKNTYTSIKKILGLVKK